MNAPEFPRPIDIRGITGDPVRLAADESEREALALRFGLVAVNRLEAVIALETEGARVAAEGTFEADIVQTCAVSGDDIQAEIRESVSLRFVPARRIDAEEIELAEEELDEIPYSGTAFDLGEAVAQSLALAIDPYATGPDADRVREDKGLLDAAASGPLAAALAALKKP